MQNFEYLQPKDMTQASRWLMQNNGSADALAGGTDILDLMKSEIATPAKVVNLKATRGNGLRAIEERNGTLHIGPLVTLQEIADSKLLKDRYTVLQQAAAAAASPQLRAVGTLGGNLVQRPRCWYFREAEFPCIRKGGGTCFAVDGRNKFHCVTGGGPCFIVHPSDPAVALVALDAKVKIQKNDDTRTVPIRDLFVLPEVDPTIETILEPGELITAVEVPVPKNGTRSSYEKFMFRQTWDFAVVSVATVLVPNGSGSIGEGRIALGGVAPVPWLEENATKMLSGFTVSESNLEQLGQSVLKDADPMSENEYKIPLARNLVKRKVRELMG